MGRTAGFHPDKTLGQSSKECQYASIGLRVEFDHTPHGARVLQAPKVDDVGVGAGWKIGQNLKLYAAGFDFSKVGRHSRDAPYLFENCIGIGHRISAS